MTHDSLSLGRIEAWILLNLLHRHSSGGSTRELLLKQSNFLNLPLGSKSSVNDGLQHLMDDGYVTLNENGYIELTKRALKYYSGSRWQPDASIPLSSAIILDTRDKTERPAIPVDASQHKRLNTKFAFLFKTSLDKFKNLPAFHSN